MKQARMPQSHHLHPLLGLKNKIPANFEAERIERDIAADGEAQRVIRFFVLTSEDADFAARMNGNKSPRRGRPRIFAHCDNCGKAISCGRFNQHFASHKQEVQS